MKTFVEKIIRMRNPRFRFDEALKLSDLLLFMYDKALFLIRGLKPLFRFRYVKFLMLGRGVRFFKFWNMEFGKFVKLGHYVYLNAWGRGKISIGNNSGIGDFSRLVISMSMNEKGEFIKIGNNVGIGEYAYLGGAGGLEIGDDCIVGQYLSCHPENHNFDNNKELIRHQGTSRKGIKIGNNCWIGSKVTVCDGVTIGDNCVIAAGAVITRDMPSNTVIGGVPAKVLRNIRVEENLNRLKLEGFNVES